MKKAPLGPKYYLAGPMSGLPEYNYPYFEKAVTRLRGQGYDIVSPHEIEYGETPETRGQQRHSYYLQKTLLAMIDCNSIIMLPGWRDSRGAVAELQLALATGMEVFYYNLNMSYPYELP